MIIYIIMNTTNVITMIRKTLQKKIIIAMTILGLNIIK